MLMKAMGALILFGAACTVLAGCSGGQNPPSTAPSTTTITSIMPVGTGTMGATDLAPTSDPADLVGWVGQYSFGEVTTTNPNVPPSAAMGYGMSIYQMGTGFFAALSISGNGATQSIMATVQGDATKITLYFNSFIGTNPWKNSNYSPGDALLTLEKADNKITTTWVSMKPQVSGNKTPGTHFTFNTPTPSMTSTVTPSAKKSS